MATILRSLPGVPLVIAWLVVFAAPPLNAQPRLTPEQMERVKTLGAEGKQLFDAGDYQRAIAVMLEAYSLYPAPKVMLNVAKCYEKLGQLQLAKEFVDRARVMNDDPTLVESLDAFSKEVERRLGLARIRFVVAPVGVRIQVDGADVGTAPRDDLELPPGRHRIRLSKPGLEPIVLTEDFPAGQVTDVAVALKAPAPVAGPIVVAAPQKRWQRPWPWIAIGVGGAALLAGGVLMGVAAIERQNVQDAIDHPNDFGQVYKMSLQSARQRVDRANTENAAGLAMLSVGGAAVAAGIVLFFLPRDRAARRGSDDEPETDQVPVVFDFQPGGSTGVGAAWQGRF